MYYLALVQNDETQALYRFSTLEEALSMYHSELAYRGEGRTSTKCLILDSDLNTYMKESYTASVSDNTEELNEG